MSAIKLFLKKYYIIIIVIITIACIYCMHEHIMPKHTLIGCQTWYDLHGNIQLLSLEANLISPHRPFQWKLKTQSTMYK